MPKEEINRSWINNRLGRDIIETFSVQEVSPLTFQSALKRTAGSIVGSLGVERAELLTVALLECIEEERSQ